jgi:ZIP family zinc transporter
MYQARRRSARTFDTPTGPGPVRPTGSRTARVALMLAPVLGLAALVAVLLLGNLIGTVSGGVPVDSLAVEDVTLAEGELELHLRNDGQLPVTIAQVTVDDAFRPFKASAFTLERLGSATVTVPYPWEPAVPVHIALLTSTGTVIEHEITSPSPTPTGTPATLGTLALIGLAMATFPVALGLLWLPFLRRVSSRVMGAVLAFTLGLLIFLLVDSTAEGLELAGRLGSGLNGIGVFALGALGALAVFAAVASFGTPRGGGMRLAWLVAIGIGLHNLGEGIAVGTAMRVGEVALGTALVIGFAIHNLTEGVAIAAPLTRASLPQQWILPLVACAAGLPAIPGLWLGGLTAGGAWAVLGLGIAAGAIAQVVLAVGRLVVGKPGPLAAASFTAAVGLMYLTGLLA